MKKEEEVKTTLREKCPHLEVFWFVFSRIQSKHGKIRTRKTLNRTTFHIALNLKSAIKFGQSKSCETVQKLNIKKLFLEMKFNHAHCQCHNPDNNSNHIG